VLLLFLVMLVMLVHSLGGSIGLMCLAWRGLMCFAWPMW